MKGKKLGTTILVCGVLAGCASVAVTEDALVQRTSFALGVSADHFTISNRVDSGVRTDYDVHTQAGKDYACYVTGTVSVTGRTVSDAICKARQGTAQASQSTKESDSPCNDLLKAAGKCE